MYASGKVLCSCIVKASFMQPDSDWVRSTVGRAVPSDHGLLCCGAFKPRPRRIWDVEVLTFRLISHGSYVIGFLSLAYPL